MILSFDPIQMQTSQRLAGVKSLLRLLETPNSEYKQRERERLRESAQKRGLGDEEYSIQRDSLEEELESLPQFTCVCHRHPSSYDP